MAAQDVEPQAAVEVTAPVEQVVTEEAGKEESEKADLPKSGDAKDSCQEAAEPTNLSFKEESYLVSDLKENEKKALLDLKARIEAAIKANEFALPKPKPEAAKDCKKEEKSAEEEPKSTEEAKGEESKNGECKIEEAKEAEATECKSEPEEPKSEAEEPKSEAQDPVTEAAPVSEEPKCESEAQKEAAVEEVVEIDEDISLWGVPLLHTKGDERTDVILIKFLRARDFKVNQAFLMLKNTIIWRKTFAADGLLEEDLGTDLDGAAYMFASDKKGHPVCYNVHGIFRDKALYQAAFGDESKINFLRWRVQLLEKGIKLLDFAPASPSALVQVVDLKNSPWPAQRQLITALNLFQDNYPELVAKHIFLHVPWYFTAFYSMISPFLTQRTKNKFMFAKAGKATETLFKYISPENVPIQYGGLGRADDTEFAGVEAPVLEISIKAGQKQIIEIPKSSNCSSLITWDLAVIGWDISYGSEYIPDTEGVYATIIEKTKKISCPEEPIRNSFKTSEPGKVVLTIDNCSSRKKKLAIYRHLIKDL